MFDETVRQRQTQVIRIAYRMLGNWADAEDVAQEAFVRLHRHGLDGFLGDAALGGWLCRVTVNLCLDRIRSQARWSMTAELPDLASLAESAEGVVLRNEQKLRLTAALAELPERERAAVVLREIEGLSTAETAAAMGSTEGTVRSQVSKALDHLRAMLTTKEKR